MQASNLLQLDAVALLSWVLAIAATCNYQNIKWEEEDPCHSQCHALLEAVILCKTFEGCKVKRDCFQICGLAFH